MLQRKQTLFLLGVVICMSITAVLPVWNYTTGTASVSLEMGILTYTDNEGTDILGSVNFLYLLGIAITGGIVGLINIFKFNNRKMQMKISMLNSLLIITYIVISYLFVPKQAADLLGVQVTGFHFQYGFFFTVVALVFNILARVFIKKDEDLVRSVDRLR
jgi:hypothetical protein